jgi:rod shape determining protein RodA
MFEAHLNDRGNKVDWPLIFALLALMIVGASFIYSASFANEAARNLPLFKQNHLRQMIWYIGGLSVAGALCFFDYRTLARWSIVAYWGSILLLVLVPLIGVERFGAKRWINLGFFQLQPSEFAKIAVILAQANFLSRPQEELKQLRIFIKSLAMTALPFFLVLVEPDLGSALVLFPITFVMMLVAGVPRQYLLTVFGLVAIVASIVAIDVIVVPKYRLVPLETYQKKRLVVFFNGDFVKNFAPPNATEAEIRKWRAAQREASYNVEQALISVGSGGLTGKGWRKGTQYSLGFLPRAVAHNDFIFSVIAEEIGFVGSVTVVALFTVVLFSGIKFAGQARDRLGKLLAVGVVAMLFSHVFINIGMNIRLMPVTGIPLPLLSYGGSSVLCSLVAIGILQNVYMYRRSY